MISNKPNVIAQDRLSIMVSHDMRVAMGSDK
jgi:hypothetical protein